MESEVVFQHYLIVHVNAFKTQLSITANEQVGILELTALKINTDGLKIESLFHDYGKLSYCRKGIAYNPKMYIPDITAVCNHANDVLEGFKIWIQMHSLETVDTPSKDHICDMNGSFLLPVDLRDVDSSTDIKNVMWPNKQLKKFLIVTWGNWHFQEFLQGSDNSTQVPEYCQSWCNAKQIYINLLKTLPSETSLSSAIARLGVRCVTDESSGIYNCINTAKIIASLKDSGAKLQVNGRLHPESSDVKSVSSSSASGCPITFESANNKLVPATAASASDDIPPKILPEDVYLISPSLSIPSTSSNSAIAASAQSVPFVDHDSSSCRISESSLSLENGVLNSSVHSKEGSVPLHCSSNIAEPPVSVLTSKQPYPYMPSEAALKQSSMSVHQNQLQLPHIYPIYHGMPSLPLGIPFYSGQHQMWSPMLKSNYPPVPATHFTSSLIANSYYPNQFQNPYLPLLQPRQQYYLKQQSRYESPYFVGQNSLENARKISATQDINIKNDPINDIYTNTNYLYPNLSTDTPTVSSANVILESDKMLSSINTSKDTNSSFISNTSLKHDPVSQTSISHGGEQLPSNFSFGSLDYKQYLSETSSEACVTDTKADLLTTSAASISGTVHQGALNSIFPCTSLLSQTQLGVPDPDSSKVLDQAKIEMYSGSEHFSLREMGSEISSSTFMYNKELNVAPSDFSMLELAANSKSAINVNLKSSVSSLTFNSALDFDYAHYQSNSSTQDHESGKRASADALSSSLQTDLSSCSFTSMIPGVQLLSNVENHMKEHLEDNLEKSIECKLQSSTNGYSDIFRHLQSSEQHIPGASSKEDEDQTSEKNNVYQGIPVHMIQKPSLIKHKKQTIMTEPMSFFQQPLPSEQQMEEVSVSIETNDSLTHEPTTIPHPSIPGLSISNPRFPKNKKSKKKKNK